MELYYKSTRSDTIKVTSSEAILLGLANDGGLFVPTMIPKLNSSMEELMNLSYQEIAFEVMRLFLTDYTEEELKFCINKAYDDKFDTEEIAPIVKVGEGYYLELFHGPTLAFKDMALSILPYLLTTAARKNKVNNDIAILVATSGDTGKAALAGFADVPGTKIIVFYPKNGVSQIQELQMLTQKGENTFVVAINGNFDDAQRGVKEIFEDKSLSNELEKNNCQLSSANSINIGRLIPQVVYYVYAYVRLLKEKEIKQDGFIDVVVPTGNFGNILAAYYAKEMGVPIGKLICASNENKVLFDFFKTGKYNKNREFTLTSSPSMDILVSSNLERLIYAITGEDAKKNLELMKSLNEKGEYEINPHMKEQLKDFTGGYATEEDTKKTIKEVFEETGYTLDPHTAVAAFVGKEHLKEVKEVREVREVKEVEEASKIIVSTASPYKFIGSVMSALDSKYHGEEELGLVNELERITDVRIPKALSDTLKAPINKEIYCQADEMKDIVRKILEVD
jgi:threonine synthase